MFSRHGLIIIEKTGYRRRYDNGNGPGAGMEDMKTHEDSFEIITDPDDFPKVKQALQEAGYEFVEADIEYLPSTEATPPEEELGKLKKMIEVLENNDDVQKVYHNCSIDLEQ
jgi:transcriptional/translational regulatory protein YebC/TACO1